MQTFRRKGLFGPFLPYSTTVLQTSFFLLCYSKQRILEKTSLQNAFEFYLGIMFSDSTLEKELSVTLFTSSKQFYCLIKIITVLH